MKNWIWHQRFWYWDEPIETTGNHCNISIEKERESIFKSSFDGTGPFGKEGKKVKQIGFKYKAKK